MIKIQLYIGKSKVAEERYPMPDFAENIPWDEYGQFRVSIREQLVGKCVADFTKQYIKKFEDGGDKATRYVIFESKGNDWEIDFNQD